MTECGGVRPETSSEVIPEVCSVQGVPAKETMQMFTFRWVGPVGSGLVGCVVGTCLRIDIAWQDVQRPRMEALLSLLVGLGLSAACGFRVFVPLLVLSLAGYSGHVDLAPGFEWLASEPALFAFFVATLLEIAGYYLPVVDNFLDSVATPAAVIAGTLVTASMITDLSPFLRWSLAVVAGGGLAGVVQGTTVLVRGASTVLTGGMGNPVVATAELGTATVASALSLVMPILALFGMLTILAGSVLLVLRRRRSSARAPVPQLTA